MENIDVICIETLEINTRDVYLTASEILLKLLGNILKNPDEEKYRRIRMSNPTIKSKFFNAVGAKQCLIKIGFVEENDFMMLPRYISINSVHRFHEHLQIRRALVLSESEDGEDSNIKNNRKQGHSSNTNLANMEVNAYPNRDCNRRLTQHTQVVKNISKVLHTSNAFLQSVEQHSISALCYEDPVLLKQALRHIPLEKLQLQAMERMREIQKAIKSGEFCEKEPLIDDLVLVELLSWFKESFFTWVDKPPCIKCANLDTKIREVNVINGEKVEVYQCAMCSAITHFPRHCDPGILLSTRRGRCGEWANCFTLLCRAMGWSARYVVDDSDHVWTEVYSVGQGRWLHCDPCENACDTPLMYEQGWGKHPKYIIAYACDDVQDVTWRYTADHKGALNRRTLCSETELQMSLELLRNERRKKLSKKHQQYLTLRTLMELVELMVPGKPKESDTRGRTSGSLSWRVARGETKHRSKHIWTIDTIPSSNERNIFTLRYSAARDTYECIDERGNVSHTMKGWNNGVYEFDKVFRKEEKDWKKTYLARQEFAEEGKLVWRFQIKNADFFIDEVSTKIETDVFENGSISCIMCSGDLCVNVGRDKTEKNFGAFQGQKSLDLTIRLMGGKGDVAWQHAQVFRQELDSNHFPFEIKIVLKKCGQTK